MTALSLIREGARACDLESQTLDFKEQAADLKKTIKDLVAASVCFANAEGGTIVVGVRDKVAGLSSFAGTTISVEQARSRIFEQTKPPLLVDVAELSVDVGEANVRLLQLTVPLSPEVHCDSQARFTMRVGTDCLPMDPSQQVAARERKGRVDWSAQIGEHLASDVPLAAVELARDRLRNLPDPRSELAQLSVPDLLRALGLLTADGRLLRAAEVLFMPVDANEPARVLYQYRQTPGGEPIAVERLSGPLVSVLARVMELVQARRTLTPVNLPTGQQIQVEDFPELAVREALANGLFHRDYHVNDIVTVEHSPEVFAVSSPGPLVSGVTPENILTHPSLPRNARLSHAAQILGLVEEVGRGVDRMYRRSRRARRSRYSRSRKMRLGPSCVGSRRTQCASSSRPAKRLAAHEPYTAYPATR
jgi:ATP-dependent DNA helicase RecG